MGEEAAAGALPQERADEILARIVWSRLTEPGDEVAGMLIDALGAGESLDLVASRTPAREIAARMRDALGEDEAPNARRIAAGIERWFARLSRAESVADLDRGAALGMSVLVPDDPAWPASLADLGHHAPRSLWMRGDPASLSAFSLAVVGARACSGYGSQVTAELTESACSAGAVIVSGAAYGVDAVAHRTALATGTPTVAVLAGGLDVPYPASHAQLLERIAGAGAVCSEMVPGSAPTRWRFLQRNRLISSLADATLVTEAGVRSGSLNTAGHSAELGRPLGAVPGPITSTASTGCHRLIREYGASLVSGAADVRELLGLGDALEEWPAGEGAGAERQPSLHRRVMDALPLRGSRAAPDIAKRAGLGLEQVLGALAELELLGQVLADSREGERRWALRRGA